MPNLIPRTVTPHPFRQLATHSLSFLRAQARCRHDSAAAESLKAQTELKEDVNQDAPPLRIRKHGFRALPVSPLMREDGARKHRREITSQDDVLKEFQKEVALNPYGVHTQRPQNQHPILTPNLSASTSDSHPILQPHSGPSTLTLPATFHHDNRKSAEHHQRQFTQSQSSHTTRAQRRIQR